MKKPILILTIFLVFSSYTAAFAGSDKDWLDSLNNPGYDKVQANWQNQLQSLVNSIEQYQQVNPIEIPYQAGTPTLDTRINQLRTAILLHDNGQLSDNDFMVSIENVKFSPNSTLTKDGNCFQNIAILLQQGAITDGQALYDLDILMFKRMLDKAMRNQ